MEQRFIELTIKFPAEEIERLQALADVFDNTAAELIAGFVSDLSGSDNKNGDEEHEAAMNWYRTLRANWG